MTTRKVVGNLVVIAFIAASELILVQGKRQKPRPDEIERVINDTHAVIWKCSTSECQPGLGLNVQCGTSIPISVPIKCVSCVKGVNYSSSQDYSTCKSCNNCGKHQNKKGQCTREEDTTECLKTCHKGFYWDKITEDCHPCSKCCGEADKHHEKQCEDSGLPPKQQCRQNNVKCHNPTDRERQNRKPTSQESLQALEIAAIAIGSTVFLVIVVLGVVIWKYYSWQEVKSVLKRCCCCFCNLMRSNGGHSVHFKVNGEISDHDLESAPCVHVSGSPLTENGKEPGTLASGSAKMTTKPVKRPIYERLLSAPVETCSKSTFKIPRSNSHPGALKDLSKTRETSEFKSGFKKLFSGPRIKRPARRGYTPLATEIPAVDDLPSKRHGEDGFLKPTSSSLGEFSQNALQSIDLAVQDPGLEKPSVLDQSTSTTELHLSIATFQVDGVPQDFLNTLLSKRMTAITYRFLRKICIKLDTLRQLFWDDFRLLGEKIGLDKDEIAFLKQKGNQTETILEKFNSQKNSCIGKFIAILEAMERNDVITVIEEWVVDEWNSNQNNSASTNCGNGYKLQTFV